MTSNKSIRVVKRAQREFLEEQPEVREANIRTERQARRLMFETITSWIDEQREFKKQLAQHWTLVEEQAD
jgi:hypothetical protein